MAQPYLGLRIVVVARFNRRYHRPGRAMVRALRGLGAEVYAVEERERLLRVSRRSLPERLGRKLRKVRPDVVLVYKGERLAPEAVRGLRHLGGRWVHWFPDSPHVMELALRLAAPYDVRYIFDTWMLDRYREAGLAGHYLPEACEPDLHAPSSTGRRRSTIAFVGSKEPLRENALSAVQDLGLRVWGPGWPDGPLFGRQFVRAFAEADIALNVHQFFEDTPDMTRYGHGANRRTFELAGIGTVQLCDAKQDAMRNFRDGEEIVLFRSAAELRSKARDLLTDPSLRATIGNAARHRALAEHTWSHRLTELLDGVLR